MLRLGEKVNQIMNKISKFMIVLSVFVGTALADVNMTEITNAMNITWSILNNVIQNTSTIISFIVLMFVIALISGVLLVFVRKLFEKLIGGIGKS